MPAEPGGPPIRTLFLSTTLALGGAERVMRDLAVGLDRSLFDVSVATLRAPGLVGEEIAAAGVPVRSGWTGAGKLDPFLIPRLHRWLARERFEILYFLDHPHALFHGLLASIASPVVARVFPVHTTGRWDGKPSVARSTRLLLPRIDAVIAIAESQRRYLVEEEGIPAAKIVVVRNGIAIEAPDAAERGRRRARLREELSIEADHRVVTILAVLRPEKNHELLLAALDRVRPRVARVLLLIVGDGPRRPFLEAEVRRRGLQDAVRFLGARSEGRRFWGASDLAVLTSHPRVETLPLSLLEAMDSALPVVATDVGALREIVTPHRNGLLVAPGDVEGLAEAIVRLLADPALAERYGWESQRIVEEGFSLNRMLRETEGVLLRIVRERRAGPPS